MRLWIPTERSARLIHAAAWVIFLAQALTGLLLETTSQRLHPIVVFLTMPLALLVYWPAVSIVAARSRLDSNSGTSIFKKLWNALFAGTPPQLAVTAFAYLAAIGLWTQTTKVFARIQPGPVTTVGAESVGFLAVSSAFALIAAVILYGHLKSPVAIEGRV